MKKLILFFSLLSQLSLMAQITDNYNAISVLNWTVFDDPLARISLATVPGRLSWDLSYPAASSATQGNMRCVRNLNNEIINSQNFRASLTYRVTTVLGTGTTIMALTQLPGQSYYTRTGVTTTDCSSPNSSITIVIRQTDFVIQIKSAAPNGCATAYQITIVCPNGVNATDRRLELTKIGDRYRFRVFDPTTNAVFVNQIFCSSVTPVALNLVQHGNHASAGFGPPAGGMFTGVVEVDDLNIVGTNVTDATINQFPLLAIGGPTGICDLNDEQITLTAVTNPGSTLLWTDPPTFGPQLFVTEPGIYEVTSTLFGCITTAIADIVDNCPPGCEDPCSWAKTGNDNMKSGHFIGTRNPADFKIRTSNIERMTVEANGFVGIGRSKPSAALHVQSSGLYRNLGATVIQTGNGNAPGLIMEETADGNAAAISAWSGSLLFFAKAGAGSFAGSDLKMTILNTGNVGIGTTPSSSFRLDVSGNVRGTSWSNSDARFKRDIETIKNSSEIISKINGVNYYFKTKEYQDFNLSETRQYGFIAQDLEKVMPEAVITDDAGFKAVNYDMVIPVLVESQKSIIKDVAELKKSENSVQSERIAKLESENELLKEKLLNYDEKFALLEKTITQLCESGCEGLKKTGEGSSSQVDVLYQSIPNPTDSEALINYSLSKEYTNAYISVSTQEGKQLMSVKLESKKGSGSIKLSLGELASGTYLYTLVAGERVIDTKRLQIVK